jgi:hypothetical protein
MKGSFCLILLLALLSIKYLHANPVAERDPTMPAVAIPTDKKDVVEQIYLLKTTIVSPTRQLALIIAIPADSMKKSAAELGKIIDEAVENAKFVKVGDKTGDATVTAIDKTSVILSWPGRKQTIYLFDYRGLDKHI